MQHFWHIIINPAAGNGKAARLWPEIEQLLQEMKFSFSVYFTTHRGHATRLVDDIALKGGRYILGIGGDGTNHEIVNGIAHQTHVANTELYYALLPVGTGNDWARQHTLSLNPKERLTRLYTPQTTLQDLGLIHYTDTAGKPSTRYFANVAGMAYDAFVVDKMEQNGKPGRQLVYLMAVMRYLFQYDPVPATIQWPDGGTTDRFYTINVGLCKYSGGGMQLVPHAIPDDGLFALTYAESLPRWEVLLQTPRFYNGTLLQHRKLHGLQVPRLEVRPLAEQPVLLEADGEFLGRCPATFTLIEKALRVVL